MDPAIVHLLESADSFALLEHVDRTAADAQVAADLYGEIADDLYWERKDLAAAIAVLRAGIQHALSAGGREEAVAHFRRAAAVAEEQEFVLMASGFVLIAERRGELAVVVDQLRAMGTEEGEAYADQLEVAEGVFNLR